MDNDGDYTNGVAQTVSINDVISAATAMTDIVITSTTAIPIYIRTPQTITIKFSILSGTLAVGSNLYLLLPGPYGEWINRGQTLSLTNCKL